MERKVRKYLQFLTFKSVKKDQNRETSKLQRVLNKKTKNEEGYRSPWSSNGAVFLVGWRTKKLVQMVWDIEVPIRWKDLTAVLPIQL